MWKKTINTLKKNPRILLGFIIPVVINLILTFPIYRSIVLTLLGDYARIDDAPNFQEVVRAYAISSPFAYILLGVFVMPPIYRYVYQAVTGKEIKVWSKEGFFKYSWRVVVKSFLGFFTLFAIFVLLFLLFAVPSLGFAMYTIAFSAWSVFWVISLTSVIVEDKFVDSLPNTFFVGRRYYFRLYFTSMITMTPAIAFSAWFMIYFHSVGMDIAYAVPDINMNPTLLAVIFLTIAALLSIYYVFAQAFLYTYSMHCYIEESVKLDEEERKKAELENSEEE